jgi:hypothetical protein
MVSSGTAYTVKYMYFFKYLHYNNGTKIILVYGTHRLKIR